MNIELQEKLQPVEQLPDNEQQETDFQAGLNAETVAELFTSRQADLKTLHRWVGLKFYYQAAEKIKQEEQTLKRLLRLETAKQTILADYSFVLDPAYFEQKFLN